MREALHVVCVIRATMTRSFSGTGSRRNACATHSRSQGGGQGLKMVCWTEKPARVGELVLTMIGLDGMVMGLIFQRCERINEARRHPRKSSLFFLLLSSSFHSFCVVVVTWGASLNPKPQMVYIRDDIGAKRPGVKWLKCGKTSHRSQRIGNKVFLWMKI